MHTREYTLIPDTAFVFLSEVLPSSAGTDELAGTTCNYGHISGSDFYSRGALSFAADSNTFTYTPTHTDYDKPYSGVYSYDSTIKRVFLKTTSYNGKSNLEYYASLLEKTDWLEWEAISLPMYESKAAFCADQAGMSFSYNLKGIYNLSENRVFEDY